MFQSVNLFIRYSVEGPVKDLCDRSTGKLLVTLDMRDGSPETLEIMQLSSGYISTEFPAVVGLQGIQADAPVQIVKVEPQRPAATQLVGAVRTNVECNKICSSVTGEIPDRQASPPPVIASQAGLICDIKEGTIPIFKKFQ